jgi:hypothetical protein
VRIWQKLADNDPMVAFKAKWDLIAAGPTPADFLADTLSAPGTIANISPGTSDAMRLHRTRELLQIINTLTPLIWPASSPPISGNAVSRW